MGNMISPIALRYLMPMRAFSTWRSCGISSGGALCTSLLMSFGLARKGIGVCLVF
jgi:hypothetical protein